MKIIVGLGNPGEEYKITRHNAGFMAVDFLAEKSGLSWEINKKFNLMVAHDLDTYYLKPLTFMNLSGQAVAAFMNYYKLLPKKLGLLKEKDADLSPVLSVIHDDLDIPLGECRRAIGSRAAGHRGVQSLIDYLKTKNFQRYRIGIKNNRPEQMPVEKYVLQKFAAEELAKIKSLIENTNFFQ